MIGDEGAGLTFESIDGLTEYEGWHLERARRTRAQTYVLEEYAGLMDSLDRRLGRGSPAETAILREYRARERAGGFDPVTDPYDAHLVETRELCFIMGRENRREYPVSMLLFLAKPPDR